MSSHLTLGEKGITTQPLYACPLCQRTGFSGPGLRTHRCPNLPRLPGGWRARLDPEMVDAILNARKS